MIVIAFAKPGGVAWDGFNRLSHRVRRLPSLSLSKGPVAGCLTFLRAYTLCLSARSPIKYFETEGRHVGTRINHLPARESQSFNQCMTTWTQAAICNMCGYKKVTIAKNNHLTHRLY